MESRTCHGLGCLSPEEILTTIGNLGKAAKGYSLGYVAAISRAWSRPPLLGSWSRGCYLLTGR